jgi:beta-mannosidase
MLTLDLGGIWTVSQVDGPITIPATVPGSVFSDLLAAKKLPDPYWRDNELDMQWVGKTDWVFTRTFEVCADLLAHDRVLLRCEGLDTLATVRLNGKRIAKTDNMHRTYEFDVAKHLKRGRNEIAIRFDSAVKYCDAREKKRKMPRCGEEITSASFGQLRKCACNFGWDWGPMLTTAGIWRDIQLVAFDDARLGDVHIRQTHARGKVTLDVNATVERVGTGPRRAVMTVRYKGRKVAEAEVSVRNGKAKASLAIDKPKLWWPAGMGDQPMYDVDVELLDCEGAMLDTTSRRIGFRTLEVVQQKDKWGTSFHFECNGVPFFAKGANWIPADAILHDVTEDDYRRLLEDALAANMNFIRVWGGGIYEEDIFYDLCDEMGLCVWQDFAFACSSYPTFDDAFNANVVAEIEDNVRRLRHHPSLAIWCGNNEIEGTVVTDDWTDISMGWDDYKILFDGVLTKVMKTLDPERLYWPSSPHTPGANRKEVNDPTRGNAHLWQVWHGNQPFEWYFTSEHRFVAEFGFQSFPEPKTVRAYTLGEDRNVTSPIMEHHQRSPIGNSKIMNTMLEWFRMPRDLDATLWLSQIQHGMAIQFAVEHWRRSMPRTMGAIYWQLNDCWPVASWASIDYFGRWKALHYAARRFYAPILVSGVADAKAGRAEVHLTCDLVKPPAGATFSWRLMTVAGKLLVEKTESVKLPANASKRIATIDVAEPIAEFGADNLLLAIEVTVGGAIVSDNLLLFARPKRMNLPDPKLKTKVKQLADGDFEITLTSKAPALWAWLEVTGKSADVFFEDNFVHVLPGETWTIRAMPGAPMTLEQFRKKLKVKSLVDTY